MSLVLSKTLPSGAVGEYWKIVRIEHRPPSYTECQVELFKDAATRLSNPNDPLEGNTFRWSGDDDPCTVAAQEAATQPSNTVKLCYEKLKTLTEFDGAVDG